MAAELTSNQNSYRNQSHLPYFWGAFYSMRGELSTIVFILG